MKTGTMLALLAVMLARAQPSVEQIDRFWGIPYASKDYTNLLKQNGIDSSMSRKKNPWDKDYVSHCTSMAPCATTWFTSRRWDSFMPCAFRGGLLPGCSNRQSFLSS